MKRTADRLDVGAQNGIVIIGGRAVDERSPQELTAFFDVIGPDTAPELAGFYVMEFERVRWIVPFLTPATAHLLGVWSAALNGRALAYDAKVVKLPFRWRERLFRLLPLLPVVGLRVEDAALPLPTWERSIGPRPLASAALL